jgi:predicted PurR-regulated permease PerM
MEPMVLLLTRRGVKRSLASGLTMLLLLVVLIGIGALFGQLLLAQVDALSKALPGVISSGLDWVNATFKTKIDVPGVERSINLTPNRVANLATSYGGGLIGVFGSLVTALFDGLTILVFAYYLSADSIRLRQTIGSFLPPKYQPLLMTVWTIAVVKTGGFVTSKVVLAAISAVAHGAFFWVIGVPFWLPLGIVAGVVGQFIPTIGTYVGVLLPCLFAATSKPVTVLYILVFATMYQQIENYVLTPRISRRTMDIHPAVALAAVFVGAALFGPIGAVIGIPVAAAVLAIVETYRHRYELNPELAALDDDISEGDVAEDEVASISTETVDS